MKEESNVEKLSGLILKLLKIFIVFVILAVIAIIGLGIYALTTKGDKQAESKEVAIYQYNDIVFPVETQII